MNKIIKVKKKLNGGLEWNYIIIHLYTFPFLLAMSYLFPMFNMPSTLQGASALRSAAIPAATLNASFAMYAATVTENPHHRKPSNTPTLSSCHNSLKSENGIYPNETFALMPFTVQYLEFISQSVKSSYSQDCCLKCRH